MHQNLKTRCRFSWMIIKIYYFIHSQLKMCNTYVLNLRMKLGKCSTFSSHSFYSLHSFPIPSLKHFNMMGAFRQTSPGYAGEAFIWHLPSW